MELNQMFSYMLSSLTSPAKTAKELSKKKMTMWDGAVAVIIGSLVAAVIIAVSVLALVTWMGTIVSTLPLMGWLAPLGTIVGLGAAVAILIAVPISALFAWVINTVIYWVVASLIGGKGDYQKFAAVWAFPTAALWAIMWVNAIPIIGMVLSLMIGVYSMYLLYMFLQPTMGLNKNKALLAVVVMLLAGVLAGVVAGSSFMLAVPAR